jgi:hypothetical protein
MGKSKDSIKQRHPENVIRKGLAEALPTSVQKSYFMLTDAERNVLNIGLQKYRPVQSEPILIRGENMLKPALRLKSDYRLRIDEIKGARGRHQLHPMVGVRGNDRIGKSGGLHCIQSELRTYLARIEETSS